MHRVLMKGLIDNVRISRSRIRSKVRAVPKTPHFNTQVAIPAMNGGERARSLNSLAEMSLRANRHRRA
jgi:hypothetical protein